LRHTELPLGDEIDRLEIPISTASLFKMQPFHLPATQPENAWQKSPHTLNKAGGAK